MGIISRASYVIRSKLNAFIGSAENPSESLDYSYERMRDELNDVKKGLADLTAQKKRLEVQRERLAENVDKHNDQAREAMRQDREELARRALEKKQAKLDQIEELESQISDLQSTQHDLEEKADELQGRIEQFRTKKETMKARYEAAEAKTRVSEAMTGVGDELGDVNRAIERVTERTDDMEARAAAMDELTERGVLEDSLSDEDQIDRELASGRSSREVEAELDTLRTEVEGDRSSEAAEAADHVDEAAVDEEMEALREEEES
ncbi:PspA/IM30 family protein [Halobacterium zhouii]|uniref:PspA/IM30 family protein n=1 Tax=Halobacterium zhouii TaxID=2902624 RepID=UPI001E4DEB6F|nr:PspA/IM30 family protein [Halobacterium zhouii]